MNTIGKFSQRPDQLELPLNRGPISLTVIPRLVQLYVHHHYNQSPRRQCIVSNMHSIINNSLQVPVVDLVTQLASMNHHCIMYQKHINQCGSSIHCMHLAVVSQMDIEKTFSF